MCGAIEDKDREHEKEIMFARIEKHSREVSERVGCRVERRDTSERVEGKENRRENR